jgi:hypothetical protein
MAIIDNQFTPLDWSKITIKDSDRGLSSITGINTKWNLNLPGALLDYSFEYDFDYLRASGLPEDEQNRIFKKELATKLVEKMIEDGHIVFTKQALMERHAVRFRAYTWVGNKDFIEQQRKNKR